MLGSYSRDEERNDHSGSELNLDSGSIRPQQSFNLIGENFRSLLNTNSRENSGMTIETTRMISEEISNQMPRKLNEIKSSLNSQIQDAITTAITEKVLPSIQNTLDTQGRTNFTVVGRESNGLHEGPKAANNTAVDRRSSGVQRNPDAENTRKYPKIPENRPKTCYTQENCGQMSRQGSVDSYSSEQNIATGNSFYFEL